MSNFDQCSLSFGRSGRAFTGRGDVSFRQKLADRRLQPVGRVMRVAPGKSYGYIIIPVVIPARVEPEEALEAHDHFKVVWTVLKMGAFIDATPS